MSLFLPDTGEQIDHGDLQGRTDDDHTSYMLLSGEAAQIVINPATGISPVMDFQLSELASGNIIDIAFEAAGTLTGTMQGVNVDFVANVTHADQSITGFFTDIPASNNQATQGFWVRSVQEAGALVYIQHNATTMAGNDELYGVFLGMGAATINQAGAEYYGINIDMEDLVITSADKVYGMLIRGPIAGDMGNATSGAVLRLQAGHDNPSTETLINFLSKDSVIMDIDLNIYPNGNVIQMSYESAETLTGELTGIDINFISNLTTDGNIAKALLLQVPLDDVLAQAMHVGSGGVLEGWRWSGVHEVTTGDAVATVIYSHTVVPLFDYHIEAKIIGVEVGAQNVASYNVKATIRDDGVGGAVIVAQNIDYLGEDTVGWTVAWVVNGGAVELKVTGAVGETITWAVVLEYLTMANGA